MEASDIIEHSWDSIGATRDSFEAPWHWDSFEDIIRIVLRLRDSFETSRRVSKFVGIVVKRVGVAAGQVGIVSKLVGIVTLLIVGILSRW